MTTIKDSIYHFRHILTLMLVMVLTTAVHADGDQGGVIVEINGFHSNSGKAIIALAALEEEYQSYKKAFCEAQREIKNGMVTWNVLSIPAGEYAIKLYHDENDNETLDSNLFDIPKEGISFSNNGSASP